VPELPEVETLRQDLAKEVVGRKIKAVAVSNGRSVRRHSSAKAFRSMLEAAPSRQWGASASTSFWPSTTATRSSCTSHERSAAAGEEREGAQTQAHARRDHLHPGGELRYVDPRTFGEMFVSTPRQ